MQYTMLPACVALVSLEFINHQKLVESMTFHEFCIWLNRPIYDIRTRKLCSYKANRR